MLVGLTMVSNLVMGVAVNIGRWDTLAAGVPAEQAESIRQVLVTTSPVLFLWSGVERIGAVAFHIGMSVLLLWGVVRSRRLLAWVLAVLLHGALNLTAITTMQAGAPPWLVELLVVAWGAAMLVWVVRMRPAFPTAIEPDLRTLPAPVPTTPTMSASDQPPAE